MSPPTRAVCIATARAPPRRHGPAPPPLPPPQPHLSPPPAADDKEYPIETKQKFKDVVPLADGDFAEFVADTQGLADAIANFGDTKMAITIGSSGVDYTDPAAPVFKGAVGFGGRGISIWDTDAPGNDGVELVWDSGSTFEVEQCAKYPWAHNAISDEEFSEVGSPMYELAGDGLKETIDEMNDPEADGCADRGDGLPGACPLEEQVDERSLKDGAGPESIVVGTACGKTIAVTATEKQGTAFVFDMSDVRAPELLFLHHLSPAQKSKSPPVAYKDGTLGDVDPESITFLTAEDSPTGYAGVLVAGAWSGTLSLYEFTMADGSKCGAPCAVDGAACANGKTCECTAHARRNLLFASQPHRDHCECH